MSFTDFKTHIKNIREEAIKLGSSDNAINRYQVIWNNYINWKKTDEFIYNSDEYNSFLLDYYNFDINNTNNLKAFQKHLLRSKKILEDFDSYKNYLKRTMFPKNLFSIYPKEWDKTINNFLTYVQEVKQNAKNTVGLKERYIKTELSYFYQKGILSLSDIKNNNINEYIIDTVNAGNIAKRKNFYVLREFLRYLFMEDILKEDLSYYIPTVRGKEKKKIPTYIKQDNIEDLLDSIPRNKTNEKRDYAIIILAARLGLRISDILNIKLKNIDWKNNKLTVIQPKTNNLNILPLSKEVGWAIIEFIKVRPKCDSEYLFVKLKYPYNKLTQFYNFNKYFDKIDIEITEENKKGIHNLRHSLAKNMLDNDIPLHIISSTLGHSINMTSSTYLKIDINKLQKSTLEVSE